MRQRVVVFNRFPQLAERLGGAGNAAAHAAAERIADDIRSRVRVDTGELKSSIAVSESDDGYVVSSGADQALSEEFGTHRQSPHPTFAPAADAETPQFVAGVAAEIASRLR